MENFIFIIQDITRLFCLFHNFTSLFKLNQYQYYYFMKQITHRNSKDKNSHRIPTISYQKALQISKINISQFNNNYEQAARYYFQQAKYLYIENIQIKNKVQQNIMQVDKLRLDHMLISADLKKLQTLNYMNRHSELSQYPEEKKRRQRRNASQIQRLYKCRAVGCQKSYGSEGTLAQHIKLKHPQIYVPPFSESHEEKVGLCDGSKGPSKEEVAQSYTCKEEQPDS